MEEENPNNNDLVWGLEGINQRELAIKFVMLFVNKLCIYSRAVEKLYTNYSLHFPPDESHNMVVLPNQDAHHDTFNDVNAEAIVDTPFDLIPGAIVGKKGLYFRIPNKSGGTCAIPFKLAVEHMVSNPAGQKPLIPVLVKGNLREFEFKNPYLHLHSVDLDKLTKLSPFVAKDIQHVVWKLFQNLATKLPPSPPDETGYDLSDFFGPSS